MVDRVQIRKIFRDYTDAYDSSDEKIRLKIDHTYRVAAITDKITADLNLPADDADLAWVIGMLHDIGRFEQVRRYQTFVDARSVDHAEFGADLLFRENLIERFFPEGIDATSREMIELAIRQHNKYRIREGLDERQIMFCQIIRDADKVDIFRVAVETPMEVIYGLSTEEIKQSAITPEVLQCFYEEHCVLRSLKKTPLDNLVGHISLIYELVYPISRRIAAEQGWIHQMLAFESENPETQATLTAMREKMQRWLAQNT